MTSPDDDLSRLIRGAVDDIEPGNGLSDIHRRTRSGSRQHSALFTRWMAVGAALAVAAVVGVAALVAWPERTSNEPGPAGGQESTSPSAPVTDPTATAPGETTVPVYFAGETPQGRRLFREFALVRGGTPALEAVRRSLNGETTDPDYSSAWMSGSGDQVTGVELTDEAIEIRTDGVLDVQGDLTDAEARLAVQQVVYTAQGALQAPGKPVRFVDDAGQSVDSVIGVQVGNGVTAQSQLDALSMMSVTAPFEGQTITQPTMVASGRANSPESNVIWEIRDQDGAVVLEGFATASGWIDRLYPWRTERIDVSSLEPGTYEFAAMTDDQSGGEGSGPTEDTKTIEIN